METSIPDTIESLLARAENYKNSSLELLKLKSVDKTSDIASTVISRLLVVLTITFFALTLTIAISLWLGELLGKTYYGFLVVALVYGVTGLILYILHPSIKKRLVNAIIIQMLN